MVTRSIFEVLLDIASTIIVPETHVTERRVSSTRGGRPRPAGNDSAPHQDHEFGRAAGRRLRGHPLSRPLVLDRRPRPGLEEPVLLHPASVHLRGDREQGHRSRPVDPDNAMNRPAASVVRCAGVRPEGRRLLAAGLAGGAFTAPPGRAQAAARSSSATRNSPTGCCSSRATSGSSRRRACRPAIVKFAGGPPMIEATQQRQASTLPASAPWRS